MKRHSTEANCARWRSQRIVWGGIRASGVTEQTRCRWHKEHGDLRVDEINGLNGLARENARLGKAVVDLTQTKWILAEAAKADLRAHPSPSHHSNLRFWYPISERRASSGV
jgi:hypothetical protein